MRRTLLALTVVAAGVALVRASRRMTIVVERIVVDQYDDVLPDEDEDERPVNRSHGYVPGFPVS
jgi:hypothetical protein